MSRVHDEVYTRDVRPEIPGAPEGFVFADVREWTGVDIDGLIAIPWKEYYDQFDFV